MKFKILLISICLLFPFKVFNQTLEGYLDGYSLMKLPSDRPIVGSTWADKIGPTTNGFPEDDLIISQSLNQIAIGKENSAKLKLILLDRLSLSGYGESQIDVVFNNLEIWSIPDLYKIPLTKGQKIIFSALKSESFDIIFSKDLSSSIKGKLKARNIEITGEAEIAGKNLISLQGVDLFVAIKVIQIEKVTQKNKSVSLKGGFSAENILGYDLEINANSLLNSLEKKLIDDLGRENFYNIANLTPYLIRDSRIEDLRLTAFSNIYGSSSAGTFRNSIWLCLCELVTEKSSKIYLINTRILGDVIYYDYAYLKDFFINVSQWTDMVDTSRNKPPLMVTTRKHSKLGVTQISFNFKTIPI